MTALQRAAISVQEVVSDAFFDSVEPDPKDIARAVLMAVRDLPTEFISNQRGQLYRTEFLDCDFTTMIDAILNEKDTTND